MPINLNNDDNSRSNIDEKDSDNKNSNNNQRNYWDWDPRKTYTGWDYQRHFAKNGLFVAFSRSNSFGVLEHNALLDALAHSVK
ncbi:16581_t:CDS:2, partial [Gigaspora margarita]